MRSLLVLISIFTITCTSHAALITNNTISGSVTNTFESLASGNTASFYALTGATYGERFAGQTLTIENTFDSLSGSPTTPLTLLANSAFGANIGIMSFAGSNIIYGSGGELDQYGDGPRGEGAVSILLDATSDIFGFDVIGSQGGEFTALFFGASGSLLGSSTQTSQNTFFGFQITSGELIKGVSIINSDKGGIGYDNFTFNEVSAPATVSLLGLVLLVMLRLRKK